MTLTSSFTTLRSHRRRWVAPLLVGGIVVIGAACSSGSPSGSGGPPTSSRGGSGTVSTSVPATTAPPATTPSTGTSSPAATSALTSAYQAETATLATYRNVVSALGSVGPFPNIVTAEVQHVATVTTLMGRYGVAAPAAAAGQSSPATLRAACGLGVTLENQIITLYTDELPKVSAYPDITTAFQNLQAAARDSHLPAFQRCA